MSRAMEGLGEVRGLLAHQDGEAHPHRYHPRTVSALVTRLIALTNELLPIQVDEDDITSPTSSILTAEVVHAYYQAAGDFTLAVPFALLEARRFFRVQARENPSDSDENNCRKLACEALARKIVAKTPLTEQYRLLSARFTVVESDGDESLATSALESAVDQQATFFLSSNEAQRCVFALWKGLLVQKEKEGGKIEYEIYSGWKENGGSTVEHFDPSRLGVPRYQFLFRMLLWLVFILAYTWAIQTPDRGFGPEDVVLYVQTFGYLLEDLVKIWKVGIWPSLNFWIGVNFSIYTLLFIALGYRIADLTTHDDGSGSISGFRLTSFQFLSSAAPLVWLKVLPAFDSFQYFGTLQIVCFRMLKEAGVFAFLLVLTAIGFLQALTGLDVADEERNQTEKVIHSLIQALLGSPTFDSYESNPFGMVLYYAWSILTLIILLNVLIALFGSAYSDCTEESEAVFLSFFASKTVGAIRAPDTFVFVAPFNLIEAFILPLEYVLNSKTYAKLNRVILGFLFFFPLTIISIYETHFDTDRKKDFASLSQDRPDFTEDELDPKPWERDDDMGSGDQGTLSKVSFDELKKRLPSITVGNTDRILAVVHQLQKELDEIKKRG